MALSLVGLLPQSVLEPHSLDAACRVGAQQASEDRGARCDQRYREAIAHVVRSGVEPIVEIRGVRDRERRRRGIKFGA